MRMINDNDTPTLRSDNGKYELSIVGAPDPFLWFGRAGEGGEAIALFCDSNADLCAFAKAILASISRKKVVHETD